MSDFLSAEEILGMEDIPFKDEVVPEWNNKKVRLIGLNGEDASKFSSGLVEMDEKGNVKAVNIETFLPDILALTLHNDQGERIFKTPEQVRALGKKSARVLKRLGDIATELSGLNEASKKDAVKN